MKYYPKFCANCSKIIKPIDDHCPICGANIGINTDKRFLSLHATNYTSILQLPPETILNDRFTILECIGKGASGYIYKAADLIRDENVALKIVEIGPLGNDEAISRIYNELEVYKRINNFKYIIKANDFHFSRYGGGAMVILSKELANEGNLRKWLEKNAEDKEARQREGIIYCKQICHGIQAIHDANALYLDVKPENFIFSNGVLKIADLDSAALDFQSYNSSSNTPVYNECERGTPIYMSPENFSVSSLAQLTFSADIYSMGVLFHEIFSQNCKPPFNGNYTIVKDKHNNESPPILSGIDVNIAALIERCLAKNPKDRPQTISTLLNQIEGNRNAIDVCLSEIQTENNHPTDFNNALYDKALSCFNDNQFTQAKIYLQQLIQGNPQHTPAIELQNQINTKYHQAEALYRLIKEEINTGNLEQLIECLKQAITIYPDHPDGFVSQELIRSRAAIYREAMENGVEMFDSQQWEAALNFFKKAEKINGESANVTQVIGFLSQISENRQKTNTAIANGDPDEAINIAHATDALIAIMKAEVNKSYNV